MPIRLRFAMHGVRRNRILHLVAIDGRKRRDALPTETLGIYDPKLKLGQTGKTVQWSVDRINYWLGVGAEPSKSVVKLLTLGGIIPPDSKYHPKAFSSSPRPAGPPLPTTGSSAETSTSTSA